MPPQGPHQARLVALNKARKSHRYLQGLQFTHKQCTLHEIPALHSILSQNQLDSIGCRYTCSSTTVSQDKLPWFFHTTHVLVTKVEQSMLSCRDLAGDSFFSYLLSCRLAPLTLSMRAGEAMAKRTCKALTRHKLLIGVDIFYMEGENKKKKKFSQSWEN